MDGPLGQPLLDKPVVHILKHPENTREGHTESQKHMQVEELNDLPS